MKIIANEITEKVKSVEICADKTKQVSSLCDLNESK